MGITATPLATQHQAVDTGAFGHHPHRVQVVLDDARYDMRRWAARCWDNEISLGKVLALLRLGHIDRAEFLAYSNERTFLVRRARERSIGV